MHRSLIRKPVVTARTGRRHSALHNDIHDGLMTRPVAIGRGAVGWPDDEIDAIINARIAGKSDDEIRTLVSRLHEARKVAA
jgi:prophage regulatory protein